MPARNRWFQIHFRVFNKCGPQRHPMVQYADKWKIMFLAFDSPPIQPEFLFGTVCIIYKVNPIYGKVASSNNSPEIPCS
jgi:hypothetical protein